MKKLFNFLRSFLLLFLSGNFQKTDPLKNIKTLLPY